MPHQRVQFFNQIKSLILFMGIFLVSPVTLGMETIVLGTAARSPISQEDQSGFLDRLVGEAMTRLGYKLKIEHLPAERALLNANAGIDDGDLNRVAGLDKDYPNLIQVPESTLDTEFSAFSRKVNLTIDTWQDLRPYTVGLIIGWKIFEDHIPTGTTLVHVSNPQQLFSLLENNRADIILFSKWLGLDYIKNNNLSDIEIIEPGLARVQMFIYLNQKHAVLAHRLAESLRQLKVDGTYQAIYQDVLMPLTK